MQINIPGTHQRHSILLNIFPLRRWRGHCRSSQQSRKSQTDSSIGNNGQNQRRLLRNRSYLVFVQLGASWIFFLFSNTACFSTGNAFHIRYHQNHIVFKHIKTRLHATGTTLHSPAANDLFLILLTEIDWHVSYCCPSKSSSTENQASQRSPKILNLIADKIS